MKLILGAVAIMSVLGVAPVAVAQDIRTEQIRFDAGASATTVRDRITGYESVSYKVGAEAGQRMMVSLSPSNSQTYFNVYGTGKGPGDEAIANSGLTGAYVPDLNRFDGTLPTSYNVIFGIE